MTVAPICAPKAAELAAPEQGQNRGFFRAMFSVRAGCFSAEHSMSDERKLLVDTVPGLVDAIKEAREQLRGDEVAARQSERLARLIGADRAAEIATERQSGHANR